MERRLKAALRKVELTTADQADKLSILAATNHTLNLESQDMRLCIKDLVTLLQRAERKNRAHHFSSDPYSFFEDPRKKQFLKTVVEEDAMAQRFREIKNQPEFVADFLGEAA